MQEPRIPLAREGYPFIGLFAFLTLICAVSGHGMATLLLAALTIFTLYFFRDPDRILPTGDDVIICPADGRVIQIDKEFDDSFLGEQAYKVSIFMSIFDVHVNRLPFSGTVRKIQYFPGKFYSANTSRGSLENEKCSLVIDTDIGRSYAVAQVAGLVARRIVCWAEPGDTIARGQRYGLIRFGSRVDLYLPMQVQLEVTVGQKVKAGETALGYFYTDNAGQSESAGDA